MITPDQFSASYTKHHKATASYIYRMVRNLDVAIDIAQAAWTRAWEKREQWRGVTAFHVWTLTIAVNILRTQKRAERNGIHAAREIELEAIAPHQEPFTNPDRVRERWAHELLERATAKERVVFEGYAAGYSAAEIAAQQHVGSPDTIKVRMFRGRLRFKAMRAVA